MIDCLTCFTGSTLVLTENGPKEIKDVQVGERVWAYDEETGDIALKKVLVTHSITKDSIFEIHLNTGEVIEATPNHPFFVHGTWFQVRDLEQGDTLKTYSEDDGIIIIDSLILRRGEFKVYNFTVEDYHTYYVGQGEVLVHNCGGKKGPVHHLATNKNKKSTVRGGPWTPRFEKIFNNAGLDINRGTENLVPVPGHKGPHPEEYHTYVYDALLSATQGLKGGTKEYRNAVTQTLAKIKKEATTSGSQVNKWLTKK
ncbi:MAG TPA: polymorphic toxin-type HINT domain-containing protein [Saprospiraceae bacterium]|nr:polymorphic toxin-type HINT domain-containing protein [Saprospiraceae bacterium]